MEQLDRPKVSVLVPIYNVEDYLRECIDSLCGQTLRDLEVIAIDDGSTDSSPQILAEYEAKDPRIRVITKPNSGYGDSMNRGLAEARGEYVGIVEPDDYISPGMYEAYVNAADATGADLVKSNYFEHVGRRDIRLDLFEGLGIAYGAPFDPADHPLVITVRPSIWSGLYRRSFLQQAGIDFACTPGASFQDASFCHMAWMAARRAVVLREPFLHYRTDNMASSSNSGEKVNAAFGEFARSRRYLEALPAEARAAFGPIMGPLCYGNYVWHFNRVAAGSKLAFAERWSQEMRDLEQAGLFDDDLLAGPIRDDLRLLMADPQRFAQVYADQAPWQDFDFARTGRTSAGSLQPKSSFTIVEHAGDQPAVTVVVPIYKVERYVRECIESLLAQTFTDFEVICVDDGSPDSSAAIARSAARGDARFLWLEKENGGQSSARNLAIEHARGTYLLCLDADDLYTPDALERLHARAEADELDYLDFTAHTFYQTASMRRVNNEDSFEQRSDVPGVFSGPDLFVEYTRRDEYFCSECLHFFKRDLLERAQLRFAPGIIHEDELFSPLLLAHAERAAFLNEPLYLRRMRADSTMTAERGLRNLVGVLYASRGLEKWLRENVAELDRGFVDAMGKRIAFLHEVAVSDAVRTPPDELDAYEATLQGDELVDFELVVRGGLRVRECARRDLDLRRTRKVARKILSVPRAVKDALEDRRR